MFLAKAPFSLHPSPLAIPHSPFAISTVVATSPKHCAYVPSFDSAHRVGDQCRFEPSHRHHPGGGCPTGSAASADGHTVYVTNLGSMFLVIPTATNPVAAKIPAGALPTEIVLAPNGSAAYVRERLP